MLFWFCCVVLFCSLAKPRLEAVAKHGAQQLARLNCFAFLIHLYISVHGVHLYTYIRGYLVCMVCSSSEHFMNTPDEYFAQNCTMCKKQFNVCIWLSGELDCIVLPRTSKPGQCFHILHFANVQISPLPSDCTNHCGCLT